jgi:formylmethanofuran dehydrogenase subunit E
MNKQSYPPDLRNLIERHGHLCVGSALGYRLAKYALKLVDKGPGLILFTASGGCPVDAIEILTGCSREKGTVKNMEEQGWGFYDSVSDEGFRFTLKEGILQRNSANKNVLIAALLSLPDNDIFNVEAFACPSHESKKGE